jgi:hypothetical protein
VISSKIVNKRALWYKMKLTSHYPHILRLSRTHQIDAYNKRAMIDDRLKRLVCKNKQNQRGLSTKHSRAFDVVAAERLYIRWGVGCIFASSHLSWHKALAYLTKIGCDYWRKFKVKRKGWKFLIFKLLRWEEDAFIGWVKNDYRKMNLHSNQRFSSQGILWYA